MIDKVAWGVIGAGDVCERKSGPPLYRVDHSGLRLVHRRNRDAGEDFARRHGGIYVGNLKAMLESEDINAVYVASPHHLHAEHTAAALKAGKHVLVEKPMALSDSDCREMIRTAEQYGRSLGVAYYRRGYPSVEKLKALIDTGVFGQVTGASVNDEFPTSHRLDLIHFLFGDIDSVRINPGTAEGYIFERMAGTIQLRTTGGILVTMNTTWTETGMPEGLMIEGSRGIIHLADLKGGRILHSTEKKTELIETGGLPYTHWGIIANFTAHLRNGGPLLCGGTEGRKSTVILDTLGNAAPDTWERIEY
ncbi:MAG: Gfo/Idh/MocA family protein [Spirochaetia bacterium]